MTLNKWRPRDHFQLPGTRPGIELLRAAGGWPTHHTWLETLSHASREEAEQLRGEMVRADISLFTALGHYFAGIAQIHRAQLAKDESDGLKKASQTFEKAVKDLGDAREREEQILAAAQQIDYSAYFVRRHEVAATYTEALARGLQEIADDLAEGFYPAAACSAVNPIVARLTANFEQDAKIEGVLNRIERLGPET